MFLNVKVIPNASKSEIIFLSNGTVKIKLQAPPENGKANKALIKLLSKYYKIPSKNIKIIFGEKSHNKIINIFSLPNDKVSHK